MTLSSIKEQLCLPFAWKENVSDATLDIYKVARDRGAQCCKQPVNVSHCLTIHNDLTWTLYVHGSVVNVKVCKALADFPAALNPMQVNRLLLKLDSLNVCAGQPDARFMKLCDTRKGKFRASNDKVVAYRDDFCSISLHGEVFPATIRHSPCEWLANGVKCTACKEYRDVLQAIHNRSCKQSSIEKCTQISSKINHRYLTTPE